MKAFLKWAGGKSWLSDRLVEMYRPHRTKRLVEPFCGALNVSLALQPKSAMLNDLNGDLINLYRHIFNGIITCE